MGDRRLTTVLLSMILGMTILTCLCYTTIFVQPNIPFNPLSPQRATVVAATRIALAPVPDAPPTLTPDQSYPPTWTTTPTNTPGPTKTATETRTPTPTKTPTSTKTSTPTDTSTPVPPPPPPTVTSTPTPLPFIVASHSARQNCADTGLEGIVTGTDGLPLAGVEIQYGEIGVAGSRFIARTDANGRYGALLVPGSNKTAAYQAHNWYAYILENGQPASEQFRFATDPIFANNPAYCTEDDDDDSGNSNNSNNSNDSNNATNEDDLPAGCSIDPCRNSNSIQIKIINWQRRETGGS